MDHEEGHRDSHFDAWGVPKSAAAWAIVNDAIAEVEKYERDHDLRKRRRRPDDQRTFKGQVAAVIANLAHGWVVNPDAGVAVPLSNQVLGRSDRYGSPALTKTLPKLLRTLQAAGWLTLEVGEGGLPGEARRTTIQAGQQLLDRLADHGIGFDDLGRSKGAEVIILRGPKVAGQVRGPLVPYADTPEIVAYRAEVETINAWLEEADIEVADDEERPIDPCGRHLRRIFNGGDIGFNKGGRLYDGFWQAMGKAARLSRIVINGETVVELDYGQMGARIAYGIAGAVPPVGDLYAIPGLDRDASKKLLSAHLASESPLRRFPPGTKALFSPHMSFTEVTRLLAERHAPIAPLFGNGLGLTIMFRESEIMIDVLLQLREIGVVGLPVHDALIIPASMITTVKTLMEEVFIRHTGVPPKINVMMKNHGLHAPNSSSSLNLIAT